ncbi:ion transporter [Natronocalculus amylovorans]|uniref:Ion transporter n=1 Tax=Natronocalculus amylovorans TaxID=2917812 RepID=A0AAE3KAS3_9EURY|nr:ion transporter [Natronocalculus amylovorans]MCL9818500.1 ion transporter [Natronocalculus amylovorans]
MNYIAVRGRMFALLDPERGGRKGRAVDFFIMGLIFLSILSIILETVAPIRQQYGLWFDRLEVFTVAVFTIEYILRIWTITAKEGYSSVRGRLRYMTSYHMVIDLLAVLPFFIGGFVDLRFLRVVRIFRIIRVFKLARYSKSLQTMGYVLRKKKPDLIISTIATGILLVLASSAIYFIEGPVQPEEFSSIPASFWWGVVTMTTVGYGDVTPVTTAGRIIGSLVAFLGIGLFALPASILASGFIEEATQEEKPRPYVYCPHCGEELPNKSR